MHRKLCPFGYRWALGLCVLAVVLLFEITIKFTFHAKEEVVESLTHASDKSLLLVGKVDNKVTTEPKRELQSILSATKRDLLISNEIHTGRPQMETMRGSSGIASSPALRPPLPSPSHGVLAALFNPRSLISNHQSILPSSVSIFSSENSPSSIAPSNNASSASSTNLLSSVRPANSLNKTSLPISLYNSARKQTSPKPANETSLIRNDSPNFASSSVQSFTHTASPNRTAPFVGGYGFAPICPETPPNLVGMVRVNKSPQNLEEEKHSWDVFPGGFYRPASCLARHRVAIVVPFRDREAHLNIFINHMMPFLKKQQLEFAIYVVELAPKETFNRAMLMNIGFREAQKDREWQCFVFHDVDLLPENDKNLYSCPANPRHMSAAVDTMDYKLPYHTIFGGVSAFSKVHFELINGFSNVFFGWGGEDDDLYARTVKKGLKITRYPMKIARYTMLKHTKDKPNPERFKYLKDGTKRMADDGVKQLSYALVRTERRKLFTKIVVSIDEKTVKNAIKTAIKRNKRRKA